jgi:hypothetical protein
VDGVERTDVYGLYLACRGDDVLAERDDRGRREHAL